MRCAARSHPRLIPVVLIFALVPLACTLTITTPGAPLSVEIQAPASGATVAVDEPVSISCVATDVSGSGIARIELFVSGESVQVVEAPEGAQDVFVVTLTWTPVVEGDAKIMVIAYRKDGTASSPVTITLTVVGMTLDPTQTSVPSETPTLSGQASPVPTTVIYVQGRVKVEANIRSGPGPFCPPIGIAEKGAVINLIEFSKDKLWYMTNYLGPDKVGWITDNVVTLLDDTSLIPVSDRTGCQGCGDGACNPGETCHTCPEDCGLCCGNGVCEPAYGENCSTCEADCGPCCSNGICEGERGENCHTCPTDCDQCCGDGVCDPVFGEDCVSCPTDCGPCCGNGVCEGERGENCHTCPTDCGMCCGDGVCDPVFGEDCSSCPTDCGPC